MSERYDYESAVRSDLAEYIRENYESRIEEFYDLDELREAIDEDAFTADSVTGNGSGSYTFSNYEAEENLAHNWDILQEALADFGSEFDIEKGAEYYDVTIRCWMLGQVLDDAIADAGIEEDDARFQCNREEEEEDAE